MDSNNDDEYISDFVSRSIWRLPPEQLQSIIEKLDQERAFILSLALKAESMRLTREADRLAAKLEELKQQGQQKQPLPDTTPKT